ncbi:MAG: glycosyltransferase family 2 protein [Candidatus Gracilibacteria bacterium]|nr:glycosyltransferase family 2 protein [Candidatus Gracilibacteria bacterium]
MSKKLISIVIPAYREEKNISLIYKEIKKIFSKISEKYNYEIIYINDGSLDNTWDEIVKICIDDKNVKGINLSRNFGHQGAISSGLNNAKGDLVVSMDCDMQDPPSLIIEMIKKWEEGYEVVYARRINRNDNFVKKYTAILYYKFHSKISDTDIPRNVGDFRLIDKKVLKEFIKLSEKDRYIRGMFARMGFKTAFVNFNRPERIYGETGYTWKKMIKLAMDGILNFSTFPLKIGAIIGFFIMFISFLFFCYIFIDAVFNKVPYPLYKWLSVIGFGFMGLQFVFMWIMGEYIGRIYNETRDRPIYIESEKINF